MSLFAEALRWDSSVLDRYDLTGPRYTSYPTAPQFSDAFSEADFLAAVERSNRRGAPLSLYFHLPFCDALCYYCGCNKVVTPNKQRARPYLERLEREMALQAEVFDTDRPVQQLHWGGGTPTFISREEMSELMAATARHFRLLDNDEGEYSIEIHPGGLAAETLVHLRSLGFNRVSMGVQDFDPGVQKAVNRFNSVAEVRDLVQVCRDEGFDSISMDLIYGLPLQTSATMRETLQRVIELAPDRLSLFNYAHMPQLFKSQRLINEAELPSALEKLELLHMAIDLLQQAGYVYVGMDHFARPEDSLVQAQQEGRLQRNFQGYSTHGDCDLLSFGVSAISAFGDCYVQNEKQLSRYQQAIDEGQRPLIRGFELSGEDRLRQFVINQLICHFALDFAAVEERFSVKFSEHFAAELRELQPMAEDGLLAIDEAGIVVNNRGRLLIRRVCMAFDAYLAANRQPRYSRII